MSDKDIIKDAKDSFARKVEAESKNRAAWLDDVRFARLGEQWPANVKKQREIDGRPCLTINRLPSFIRQVTNDARQNRPSIKVHPVGDDASEETAEIQNGLIRNIEYTSNADVAYDTALDHAVTGGFGYFRISTDWADDDAFDQDILIERISNPLSVYGDERCFDADSANWDDAFVTQMYTEDEYTKKWGKKVDKVSWQADAHDKNQLWFTETGVRVAEWWTREDVTTQLLKLSDGMVLREAEYLKIKPICDQLGITVVGTRPTKSKKVTQRILSGADVLETNDWQGRYIPIIPVYGDDVIIEGERFFVSLVRFAKDPQQMLNYWRSASTELVALAPKAPYIGKRGTFTSNADKWGTANTINHAYIEYDTEMPQRQSFSGPPAGALQEALNASDDMKSIMGIYDASLGARSNETSGRAIMARQREGDVSTFNFIDNLSRAIRHAGRVIVDLIPHVYSTERVIRVIHEDGTNERVPVNQPIQGEPNEQQEMAQGLVKMYDLTTGKYDVTVEAGPSFTTKREEASAQMVEFIRAYPQAAPLIGDLLAKNLDWPGADDIAERLKAMLPPQIQGQDPQVQQLQQQMQQMDAHAREAVGQLQQQLQGIKADKNLELRKILIDAYNAETDRMKVIGDQQQASLATAQEAQADLMAQQAPQGQPASAGFSLPQQQGIGGIGAPQ